jgi:hypothetical protein
MRFRQFIKPVLYLLLAFGILLSLFAARFPQFIESAYSKKIIGLLQDRDIPVFRPPLQPVNRGVFPWPLMVAVYLVFNVMWGFNYSRLYRSYDFR